ncbi:hypothetical protein C3486_21285 [Streptomyces sp. Ru73]|uniref:hypothetical protein n=1 Tax=Streptomyces sp. Ru73 TaxID=2080748 RepID=UPI000CDD7DE4|nr:hypothetical protein [Streptomyces sp. Ru73]POX38816.1 hypothetical protein C3486_21285 [Streptomyces sp. Ru73]
MHRTVRGKSAVRRQGSVLRTGLCSLLGAAFLALCAVGTAHADEPTPPPAPPVVTSLPSEVVGLVGELVPDFHDWG